MPRCFGERNACKPGRHTAERYPLRASRARLHGQDLLYAVVGARRAVAVVLRTLPDRDKINHSVCGGTQKNSR